MAGLRVRWGVVATVALAAGWVHDSRAQEVREVRGRVVDEDGRPVAGATVSDYWRANGSLRKPDGSAYVLKVEAELREFWGCLGRMEPSTSTVAVTDEDGRFVYALGSRKYAIMAMDADRGRGGVFIMPAAASGSRSRSDSARW